MADQVKAKRSMPAGYSALKAAQAISFLVLEQGGVANMIKTVKLAYMSDRKSLDMYELPIFNDDFYCLDHGPIDSYTLDLMKGKINGPDQGVWSKYISQVDRKTHTFGLTGHNNYFGELSEAEEDVMRRVVKRFADYEPFELVDWIHDNCREWSNPRGTSSYLSYNDVLKALGKSNVNRKVRIIDMARRMKQTVGVESSFAQQM